MSLTLWNQGFPEVEAPAPAEPSVDEPLEVLARFTFDWAERLCGAAGCAEYHRGWSTVRAWAAGSGLPDGVEDFLPAMTRVARDGRIRVMLSGAADTGLAAALLASLRPSGIEPSIVLVDLCQTPLIQNTLFARHAGFEIETVQGAVSDVTVAPVDAVLSHSFLGFVAPDQRAVTVTSWVRNLRRGGVVLYSSPLIRDGAFRPSTSSAEYLDTVRAEVERRARAAGHGDAEAMARAAAQFWAWPVPHRQPPEDEVLGLFGAAGLVIAERHLRPFRKFAAVDATGREAKDYRQRLNIVAERL